MTGSQTEADRYALISGARDLAVDSCVRTLDSLTVEALVSLTVTSGGTSRTGQYRIEIDGTRDGLAEIFRAWEVPRTTG